MHRFSACLIACLAITVADCQTARSALTIQNYNSTQHDRFAYNANFIGNGFNWCGVGRTSGSWGTLISPTFVLTATHAAGAGPIRFYTSNDPNGGYVQRNIIQNIAITQSGSNKPSDLTLSRLDSAVSGVDFFPIIDLIAANADISKRVATRRKSKNKQCLIDVLCTGWQIENWKKVDARNG